jgi:hypothetical protein
MNRIGLRLGGNYLRTTLYIEGNISGKSQNPISAQLEHFHVTAHPGQSKSTQYLIELSNS